MSLTGNTPCEGGLDRSARVRCGKEDQRQEASSSRRHARPADAGHRSFRRCSGPRRRRFVAGHAVWPVPLSRKAVRRQRLYQGPIFADALAKILSRVKIEIVTRSDQTKGFVTLPKRWIVERTIAWLNRCRRLAKDWENLNLTALVGRSRSRSVSSTRPSRLGTKNEPRPARVISGERGIEASLRPQMCPSPAADQARSSRRPHRPMRPFRQAELCRDRLGDVGKR